MLAIGSRALWFLAVLSPCSLVPSYRQLCRDLGPFSFGDATGLGGAPLCLGCWMAHCAVGLDLVPALFHLHFTPRLTLLVCATA